MKKPFSPRKQLALHQKYDTFVVTQIADRKEDLCFFKSIY